jgi:4-carboxymuconolactone decarboxylase
VLLVWDIVRELLQDGTLSEPAYAAGVGVFGEPGLVELTVTVGYYTTLALVMNATNTTVPAGMVQLPRRRGSRS